MLLIAFSGGVDSGFLAKVARDVLGKKNILAVTAVSPSLGQRQKEISVELAAEIDLPHRFVFSQEWKLSAYLENTPQRCYHCKGELYSLLIDVAKKEGFSYIANGANLDDKNDFRPGQNAAKERGILSPLQSLAFTKKEIRAIAKKIGLSIWDKPASPCLSSRIPHFQKVTVKKLEQIEKAEHFLLSCGFRNFRVRHHGDLARIELSPDQMGLLWDVKHGFEKRDSIRKYLQFLGFKYVSLDLEPFQSGRMSKGFAHLTNSDDCSPPSK